MSQLPTRYKFAEPYVNAGYKSPLLVVSTDLAKEKFLETRNAMPWASIYYAIKANPHHKIIKCFQRLGSKFDCASFEEIAYLKNLGVPSSDISFGNTIKKASSIRHAYNEGVRMFATDCMEDLTNIAEHAPGSKVYIRVLVDGAATAQWPLNRKFGTSMQCARYLVQMGGELGLDMYGLSFHVGSQQLDTEAWSKPIDDAVSFMKEMNSYGIANMRMINLGGGLPADYEDPLHQVQAMAAYSDALERALAKHKFSFDFEEIIIEPGRSLVGECGVIISEVISRCEKSEDSPPWLYTDVGVFGGLIETLGEAIHYPLVANVDRKDEATEEYIIAGPTCDSADIMYKDNLKKLPAYLKGGDTLFWLCTGAYTYTYSSVNFNGFGPLSVIALDETKRPELQYKDALSEI